MHKTTWEAVEELPDTQQEALLNRFGYEVTGNRHTDCPICGKKNKSGDGFRLNWTTKLSIPQYAGICAGCGPHGIYKLLTSAGADIHQINDLIGFKYGKDELDVKKIEKPRKLARAEAIFSRGIKIKDSQEAIEYFSNRGIYTPPGGHCRFVKALEYYNSNGVLERYCDAIVCIATDSIGKPCYYHVTYIEGGFKAKLDPPRKQHNLMPSMTTPKCSIKFSEPNGSVLAVGEGIESCLSYNQIYRINAVSCLNSTLLCNYRPPEYVTELHIAADNDRKLAGQANAWMLAHKVMCRCSWINKIIIKTPKIVGADFNDVLLNGYEVDEYVTYR